jgi:hypothetical protein
MTALLETRTSLATWTMFHDVVLLGEREFEGDVYHSKDKRIDRNTVPMQKAKEP